MTLTLKQIEVAALLRFEKEHVLCLVSLSLCFWAKVERAKHNVTWWCSILVRAAGSQEGPKNPLKGIAMKPVVPALNASLGWVLEGRLSYGKPCGFWAVSNGMEKCVPVTVETYLRADNNSCYLGKLDGTE